MENNQIKNLINKFLSLILDAFNAEQHYLDLKLHHDEKCDYIDALVKQINEQKVKKKKSLEEQEKYEESLKETKLSVVDAHIYKEKIHNFRLTRWICDEEIDSLWKTIEENGKVRNKFKLETDLAHIKYNELNNSLNSFCANLSEIEFKQIIEYFDYDNIDKKTQKEIIDSIINCIVDDIKTIYDYCLINFHNLFFYQNYEGPITLINIILERKKLVEENIENYSNIEKRLIEIEPLLKEYTSSGLKFDEELQQLRISVFNLIFKRKLIAKLGKERYDNYMKMRNHIIEKNTLIGEYKKVKESKNILYENYKRVNSWVPKLINKLGEKSLRKLIIELNIDINQTEDNYFNEKEEMKLALKKWFYFEEIKLEELINTEDKVEIGSKNELKILKK